MSVYDELMNEEVASPANPLSKPTGNTGKIGTALYRNPAARARWVAGKTPTAPGEGKAQSRYQSQRKPMTGQEKTAFRRRWSGDTGATRKDPATGQMVQTTGAKVASTGAGATFRRPGTAYAMRSGTEYEGPSLREKVEYLHEFLGGVRRVAGGVAGAARGVVGGVRRVAGGVAGGVRNVQSAVGRFQTRIGQGIEKALTGKVAAHELARKEADSRAMYRRQHQRNNRLARNAGFPETPGDGTEWMDREAAGTTYEGPSLREEVEYIRSFLESRTTRRKPHISKRCL